MIILYKQSKKWFCLLCIALLVGSTMFNVQPVQAAKTIYYVKETGNDSFNGTSWATAFKTLQKALDKAKEGSGDEIWIAEGTYYPTKLEVRGMARSETFIMKKNVAVFGGFPANGDPTFEERDFEAYETVLSGDLSKNDHQKIYTDNAYTVVTNVYPVNKTTIIDGVTITAGRGSNFGGGVSNRGANPTIKNVVITKNSVTQDGGGMDNLQCDPILINVTFSENEATDKGGALYNTHSNPRLEGVVFSENRSSFGAGMYNNNSNPQLKSVTFMKNTATTSGGGMANVNSHPTLINTTLDDNSANISGGGMYNLTSNPILTDVSFINNQSSLTGGGLFNNNSNPTLTNVSFEENHSVDSGGAMRNYKSDPIFVGGEIIGNTSKNGGGIYNDVNSSPSLKDVWIADNEAETFGGGMYNSASTPTLEGVTFKKNHAKTSGGGMYNSASTPMLENVTFSENDSGYYGGGMYNSLSHPTLENVLFSANKSSYHGGGMFNSNSNPTLTDVEFKKNHADTAGGALRNLNSSPIITGGTISENTSDVGAGISNKTTSHPELTDVIISGNKAVDNGGGIANEESNPKLSNVIINKNESRTNGGGIYNKNSHPIVTNTTISENKASISGGGIQNYTSHPTLTNVEIKGNTSLGSGGGMSNSTSNPSLTNVTFSGNEAPNGSAMYNFEGIPTLLNVTLSGNKAAVNGAVMSNSKSHPVITNSIIWGNSSTIYNDNSSPTFIKSIIEGSGGSLNWKSVTGIDGGGNLDEDPLFVEWKNPDYAPTIEGDYRVKANSAAILESSYIGSLGTNEISVKFSSDNEIISEKLVNPNELLTPPSTPLKTAHTFMGWFKEDSLDNAWVFNEVVTEEMTLFAKWELTNHRLTFNVYDGTPVASQQIIHGQKATKPVEDPIKENYTFAGWYAEEDLKTLFDFETEITQPLTVHAKWSKNPYKVVFSVDQGTPIVEQLVKEGEKIIRPSIETEKTGYSFVGWYKEPEFVNQWDFDVDAVTDHMTLYAKWEIHTFTLSYAANDNGSIKGSANQTVNYKGNGTEVKAIPNTGYQFINWSDGSTDAIRTDILVTENLVLTANFAIATYEVTFHGYDDNGPKVVTSNHGEKITAPTNQKRLGSTFAGWYTDSSLTTPFDFSTEIKNVTTIYAKWTINTYALTYETLGNGTVSGQRSVHSARKLQ